MVDTSEYLKWSDRASEHETFGCSRQRAFEFNWKRANGGRIWKNNEHNWEREKKDTRYHRPSNSGSAAWQPKILVFCVSLKIIVDAIWSRAPRSIIPTWYSASFFSRFDDSLSFFSSTRISLVGFTRFIFFIPSPPFLVSLILLRFLVVLCFPFLLLSPWCHLNGIKPSRNVWPPAEHGLCVVLPGRVKSFEQNNRLACAELWAEMSWTELDSTLHTHVEHPPVIDFLLDTPHFCGLPYSLLGWIYIYISTTMWLIGGSSTAVADIWQRYDRHAY